MIKANELRVGNYVNYKPIDDICDLSLQNRSVFNMIDVDDIHLISTGTMNDRFEPIQLTEHWLIKFGFSTTQWDNFNSYRLMVGDNDYTIVIYSDGNCEVGDIVTLKIKSVHQLQNLYFALTGEELEIKK